MQTNYSYSMPQGIAGGLLDIRPYENPSRNNAETKSGVMLYGMGLMQGPNPGVDVLVPTSNMTSEKFEGICMTGHTKQMTMAGEVIVNPGDTVGALGYGSAWGRVADGVTPAYGEVAYLIISGEERGYFTNDDGGGTNLDVKCRFISGLGTGNIAQIERFNQSTVTEGGSSDA